MGQLSITIRAIIFAVCLIVLWVIVVYVRLLCKRAKRREQEGKISKRRIRIAACIFVVVVLAPTISVAARAGLAYFGENVVETVDNEETVSVLEGPISSADDIAQGFLLSEVDGSVMLSFGMFFSMAKTLLQAVWHWWRRNFTSGWKRTGASENLLCCFLAS